MTSKVYGFLIVYGKQGKRIIWQYPYLEKEVVPPKNQKEDRRSDKTVLVEQGETWFDLDMTVLANMLLPSKKELVNRNLKISIDEILFLGRPTSLETSEKIEITHFSIVFALFLKYQKNSYSIIKMF